MRLKETKRTTALRRIAIADGDAFGKIEGIVESGALSD
jgi:hypothetical protein